MTTIRAYNKQEILQKEFDHIQDLHSSCYFLLYGTATMFGLYVDLLSTIFMTCIVSYYMLFETDASAVVVGLAISQVMTLTGLLPWGEKVLCTFEIKCNALYSIVSFRYT